MEGRKNTCEEKRNINEGEGRREWKETRIKKNERNREDTEKKIGKIRK